MWKATMYDGSLYEDPRDELKARVEKAREVGDTYLCVSIDLALECVKPLKECDATTIVNGDQFQKMLVEVKCRRPEGHIGYHVHGKTNW
jgi:hypothetical protein